MRLKKWQPPTGGRSEPLYTLGEVADRLGLQEGRLRALACGRHRQEGAPKVVGKRSDGRYLYRLSEMKRYLTNIGELK